MNIESFERGQRFLFLSPHMHADNISNISNDTIISNVAVATYYNVTVNVTRLVVSNVTTVVATNISVTTSSLVPRMVAEKKNITLTSCNGGECILHMGRAGGFVNGPGCDVSGDRKCYEKSFGFTESMEYRLEASAQQTVAVKDTWAGIIFSDKEVSLHQGIPYWDLDNSYLVKTSHQDKWEHDANESI